MFRHTRLIYGESRIGGNCAWLKKKLSIEDILENLRAQIDLLEDKINDIQDQDESEDWDSEDEDLDEDEED